MVTEMVLAGAVVLCEVPQAVPGDQFWVLVSWLASALTGAVAAVAVVTTTNPAAAAAKASRMCRTERRFMMCRSPLSLWCGRPSNSPSPPCLKV